MFKSFKSNLGVFILVAILAIVLPAPMVTAQPPLDVHIEVPATIGAGLAPFVASGPAVDQGILCATGTEDELSVQVSGPPEGDFRILRVVKQFVCDDGSGTFDVNLVVRLDLTTNDTTARWNVIGGTGDYADLHGSGSLVGIPLDPGVTILDIYDGRLH